MSDPVADKSRFLRMYMSNHPDTLVAFAKWFGKVSDSMTGAEMKSIDSKSMTLTCTLTSGEKKDVYIPIEPHLNGYEDVKPRLLEMKAIAQERLGMIKAPRITAFHLPRDAVIGGIIIGIILYLHFAPKNGGSPFYEPARLFHVKFGHRPAQIATYTLGVFHFVESLYTFTLCRKYHTGFLTGATYCLATLVCGFPIWKDFNKRVQAARIESVMKVE